MLRWFSVCLLSLSLSHCWFQHSLLASSLVCSQALQIQPPQAQQIPTDVSLHGDVRYDSYYWLRNKESLAVIEYLEAWNDYTEQAMEGTQALQEILYQEISAKQEARVCSAPYHLGNYDYYTYHKKEDDYPVICRKHKELQREEVLVDQNALAQHFDYFKVKNWVPSPNGKYLALVVDMSGTQYCTLLILDCETNEYLLEEQILQVNASVAWSNQSHGIWYIGTNEIFRENKVLFHIIGTSSKEDPIIFEEPNPMFNIEMYPSNDRRFIFINSVSKTSSEVRYLSLDDPSAVPQLIHPQEEGLQYFVESYYDSFYIKAKQGPYNNELMIAPIANPGKANWKVLIPTSESTQIVDMQLFQHYLVLAKLEDALLQIEVQDLISHEKWSILFPDIFYAVSISDYQEFETDRLRLCYSSFLTPQTIYEYDMQSRKLQIAKQRQVPEFDPSLYIIERLSAQASDGTFIPISLFYKKDRIKENPSPMLLYGYGAYETILDNPFSASLLSLIDRGIVFAVAHVRGGGEGGRKWYEEGRSRKKMNTFTDFIRCAEYLIEEGYTVSHQLIIEGRSAGGLLIGAVINMRPDLFQAAIAEVPFVDVLTTMADPSIPLTTQEIEEWGNSAEIEDYYYMKVYSPYDNIKKVAYPALFITAGLHDAQVAYWEPAKWVAKLTACKIDQTPLLFKINMKAGHHSYSGREFKSKETAFKYAFILDQLN